MDLRLPPSFLNCYSSLINLYTIFANQNLGMNFNDIINQLIIQSVRLLGVVILPILILFLNPESIPNKKCLGDTLSTEMNFEFIEANSYTFDNNHIENTCNYFTLESLQNIAFLVLDGYTSSISIEQKQYKNLSDFGIFIPPPELA